jgi:hypothetical protein
MRREPLVIVFSFLIVTFCSFAQQPVATTPATQDPQAVSVLNQVFAAAGGLNALSAIQDATGNGTITYSQPSGVQGTAVLRVMGFDHSRVDATLPAGIQSVSVSDGQVGYKSATGTAAAVSAQAPLCPACVLLPYLVLVPAVNNPSFSVLYRGTTQVNGASVQQIELQEIVAGLQDPNGQFREYHTIDFFIDSTTFHILMMQDVVPSHLVRQIQFSNYQNANGILIPFAIAETCGGLPTWTLTLSQETFNAGLQDSDFQL